MIEGQVILRKTDETTHSHLPTTYLLECFHALPLVAASAIAPFIRYLQIASNVPPILD